MAATVETRFANAYVKAGGRNVGTFPWADIMKMLMELFGGCVLPAVMKRWARRNEDAFKDMVETKLKEEGTFASSKDRAAAAVAAHKTFLGMSDTEIREMIGGTD